MRTGQCTLTSMERHDDTRQGGRMRYDLHHVSIPVLPGQLDAGREFYMRALGLEEIPAPAEFEPGRVVWFRLGERELHLFKEEGANASPSARHLALEVDDLDAA